MVIERQLGGSMERSFGPQGMEARLIVPLTHERWPEPIERAGSETAAEGAR